MRVRQRYFFHCPQLFHKTATPEKHTDGVNITNRRDNNSRPGTCESNIRIEFRQEDISQVRPGDSPRLKLFHVAAPAPQKQGDDSCMCMRQCEISKWRTGEVGRHCGANCSAVTRKSRKQPQVRTCAEPILKKLNEWRYHLDQIKVFLSIVKDDTHEYKARTEFSSSLQYESHKWNSQKLIKTHVQYRHEVVNSNKRFPRRQTHFWAPSSNHQKIIFYMRLCEELIHRSECSAC